MLGKRTMYAGLAAIAALLPCAAAIGAPVTFVSEKPLYAKVIAVKGDKTPLAIAFDESGGTGSGYDAFYVDTNNDGVFDANEKLTVEKRESTVASMCRSNPLEIQSESNAKVRYTGALRLTIVQYLDAPKKPDQFVVDVTLMWRSMAAWCYAAQAPLAPVANPRLARVVNLGATPRLTVEAKPDPGKAGNTGLAMSLIAAGNGLGYIVNSSGPAPATIRITDADGKAVLSDKKTLGAFAFG